MTKYGHLISKLSKTGGRNRTGRITVRHIGGGHKQKYRKVGMYTSPGIWQVMRIEYDPIRTAKIALLKKLVKFEFEELSVAQQIYIQEIDEKNTNKEEIYIYALAENEMKEGQKIINLSGITKLNQIIEIILNDKVVSHLISIKGSIFPIKYIPLGTSVYSIQDKVGIGIKGKYIRSAGMKGTVTKVNTYTEKLNKCAKQDLSRISSQNTSLVDETKNQLIKFVMTNFNKNEILIEQKLTKPNYKPTKWHENILNIGLNKKVNISSNLDIKEIQIPLLKINVTQSERLINSLNENLNPIQQNKENGELVNKVSKTLSNQSTNLLQTNDGKNIVQITPTLIEKPRIKNETSYYTNNALIEIVSYGSLNNEKTKTIGSHSRTKSIRYITINSDCCATIGTISNIKHIFKKLYKAGQSRWLGIRPTVRGEAMNAVDHPHGGRTRGGRVPKTAWGKLAHGGKTASKRASRNKN